MYHPKANPIKDVYAALMRRQMQWSHLISDKWAPRFHSLWSRSSFLVSTFLFFCQRNHVCGHFSALQICREGAKTQHWAGTIYERNYLLPVPTMLAKLFWIHISVFIPVQFLEMFFPFFCHHDRSEIWKRFNDRRKRIQFRHQKDF